MGMVHLTITDGQVESERNCKEKDMKFTKEQIRIVNDKFEKRQKLGFEEFLILLSSYGELEFSYKFTDYGILRLNDDYSSGKDKECNREKDYYAIYEINNIASGFIYRNLEEFAQAKIKGTLLKNIWHDVKNINDLCITAYHGYDGVHEHIWTNDGERGPAIAPSSHF